jgi:hypothetical protein
MHTLGMVEELGIIISLSFGVVVARGQARHSECVYTRLFFETPQRV